MTEFPPSESAAFVTRIDGGSLPEVAVLDLLRAVLDRGVPFRFQAMGFSMMPIVQNGDVITVAPLLDAAPEAGDVVAFVLPDSGKLVVHRVVAKQGEDFLTRGDNSGKDDGLVLSENILGYVSEVERNGKRVHLGLGPERPFVAWLSRLGLFRFLWLWTWRLVYPIFRRCRWVHGGSSPP